MANLMLLRKHPLKRQVSPMITSTCVLRYIVAHELYCNVCGTLSANWPFFGL